MKGQQPHVAAGKQSRDESLPCKETCSPRFLLALVTQSSRGGCSTMRPGPAMMQGMRLRYEDLMNGQGPRRIAMGSRASPNALDWANSSFEHRAAQATQQSNHQMCKLLACQREQDKSGACRTPQRCSNIDGHTVPLQRHSQLEWSICRPRCYNTRLQHIKHAYIVQNIGQRDVVLKSYHNQAIRRNTPIRHRTSTRLCLLE
ncbi:hypothetical protein L210DRAFT_2433143 [Boletus edulis BED1]|uniref:Uncharacterized protein n=1 Tax=Boletus edulis BED1 TaxID=1328754 RepID=A0AAD4GCE0_BOLED|nr:hypothetical protein L210DRAFT_2433143 [Boletus edulis BED1]